MIDIDQWLDQHKTQFCCIRSIYHGYGVYNFASGVYLTANSDRGRYVTMVYTTYTAEWSDQL